MPKKPSLTAWAYLLNTLLIFLNAILFLCFEPKPFLVFLLFLSVLLSIQLTLKEWRGKKETKILKTIHFLFYGALVLGLFLGFFLLSLIQSPQKECKKIDEQKIKDIQTMIVLGAGLEKGEPEPHLVDRLKLATKAVKMKKGVNFEDKENGKITIVVTGGIDRHESISEARAMGTFLVKHGVPEEWIIYEEKATSTFQNFEFSRDKLIRLNAQQNAGEDYNPRLRKDGVKILLITSDFHVYRSVLIAKQVGFNPVAICSSMPPFQKIGATLREIAALAKDILKTWKSNLFNQ